MSEECERRMGMLAKNPVQFDRNVVSDDTCAKIIAGWLRFYHRRRLNTLPLSGFAEIGILVCHECYFYLATVIGENSVK